MQDSKVSVDTVPSHKEGLLEETLLTLRDANSELLAEAYSQRLPKTNVFMLYKRYVVQQGRNMLHAHHLLQRTRVLHIHQRLVNLFSIQYFLVWNMI